MKKLDDIPKKGIYEVPEGYFDRLPGIIQARVAENSPRQVARPYFRYALQYAVPVILLAVISLFLLKPKTTQGAEELMASVATQDLVSYLEDSDITVEQLLFSIDVDDELVDAIEEEVYSSLPLGDYTGDIDFELGNL